jgi:hypothetical protein
MIALCRFYCVVGGVTGRYKVAIAAEAATVGAVAENDKGPSTGGAVDKELLWTRLDR